MADTIKTNLGPVTAYADAKAHGYTGTREEFGQLLAGAAGNLQDAVAAKEGAEAAKEGAEAAKQAAETAQQAAAENQKNAGTQAANAKASADTAAEQANAAKESATGAANSASAAQESETNAGLSATAAANAEAAAKQAQNAAETAKTDAEAAKTAAGTSADAAANSAADAKKTLESIPADYSALSGKVDDNTSGIRELKEDISNRGIVNGGKNLIGNEADKLYAVGRLPAGTKLTISMKDGGLLTGANLKCYDGTKTYVNYYNAYNTNKRRTFTLDFDISYVALTNVISNRPMQLEIGDTATEFEDYAPNVAQSMNLVENEYEELRKADEEHSIISTAINTGVAQSLIFSSFGYYKSGTLKYGLGSTGEKITADYYNAEINAGSSAIQSLFGKLRQPIAYSDTKTLYVIITSSIAGLISLHLSAGANWAPSNNPLVGSLILKKGTNICKVELKKQYSHEVSPSEKDFTYVLFQAGSATAYKNFVFDAYVFDNSNLYDILTSFDLSEYYTKSEIDSLIENSSYNYKIIFWGDSLTAGAGGNGTTYPKVCAEELGITNYLNAGVGGETANTIASRNGANNMIIPAGGVNGQYNIGDLKDAYGTNILPLRQGTGGDTVNPIVINGHECTLSLSQTSYTDANATYTITGYTGEPTTYPMPCKFSGCNLTADITVIFVGQNGPSFEQRLSIIDSIVSRTNGKYIVLTLSSGTEEQMKTQEATMLSKYGNHLFKTREMLANYGMSMMGMSPTDEDASAITNGTVPPSLRIDSVHLNANGYTALGKMLATHIRALGYVN
jgi:lysophospholipase L1-like esterase